MCQVLNVKRVQALEEWLKATNIKLTQVNGQRKYGGPPEDWDGPPPGVRCEVFINKIPRDAYEDLLIPLFSSVGQLWEFRLMMNFSGQNRGFAYAKYGTAAMASSAVRLLHGHMLEPGCNLSVHRSTEKKHLCIEELPAHSKQEELLMVLRELVEGVDRVSLKGELGIQGVSAIVAFTSHYAASMAKKVLMEEFKKRFYLHVSVKWHLVERMSPDDRWLPPRALKFPLPSPILPPRLARTRDPPQGFCRAVGGPTSPSLPRPMNSPCSIQGRAMPTVSPVLLLRKLCQANGFGQPIYEMFFSHAGSDGFLYFTYHLHIPRAPAGFKGVVMILPGPSHHTMLEEAKRAAAQQVLLKLSSSQLAS